MKLKITFVSIGLAMAVTQVSAACDVTYSGRLVASMVGDQLFSLSGEALGSYEGGVLKNATGTPIGIVDDFTVYDSQQKQIGSLSPSSIGYDGIVNSKGVQVGYAVGCSYPWDSVMGMLFPNDTYYYDYSKAKAAAALALLSGIMK